MENSDFLHGIEHLLRYGVNELPDGVKLVLTVNDQTGNVWLTAQDVDAVPISTRINGKSLAKSVELTPDDIQALALKSVEVGEGQVIRVDGATIADLVRRLRDIEGTQVVITVNNKTGPNITLSAADVGASPSNHGHSDLVPALRTINKKALTGDITLSASDVGAAASSHSHSDLVPTARKVNNKALTGDITLSASDVGAAASSHSHSDLVPTARKVNNKALTGDITLSAADVGAPTTADLKAVSDRVGNLEGVDVTFEELPFPDVWIPFSDSLVMLAGYGDEVKVGGYTVAKMASFSRASTATYIDKSSALRTAAVNEPRFEKEGLLIEGQSTNILNNSERCLDRTATTVMTSVDGWYDISLVSTTGSTNGLHFSDGTGIAWPASTAVTLSVFVKGSGKVMLETAAYVAFTAGVKITFDLDNKTTTGGTGGVIQDLGGGVYRLSIQATTNATPNIGGNRGIYVNIVDGNTDIKANYAQIEALPFASSYIPTNGAAATRTGDVCYVPRVGNYNKGPLTFSLELDYTKGRWTYFNPVITFDSTNAGKRIQLTIPSNQDQNQLRFEGESVHINSGNLSYDGPVACRLTTNQASICTGGNIATVTSTSDFSHDGVVYDAIGIGVGTRVDSAPLPSSSGRSLHIRNFRIWHRALSDNQLKSIR